MYLIEKFERKYGTTNYEDFSTYSEEMMQRFDTDVDKMSTNFETNRARFESKTIIHGETVEQTSIE